MMTVSTSNSGGFKKTSFTAPFVSRVGAIGARLSTKIKDIEDHLDLTNGRKTLPWFSKERLALKELKLRKWLFANFLDFDFNHFPKYKKWGITFAKPPMGALSLFAFGGLAGWRALRGYERGVIKDKQGKKIGRDTREVRDVLVRDIWAITVYLWGLKYLSAPFIKWGESKLGLSLSHKGSPLDFSDIEANRTLKMAQKSGSHFTNETAVKKLAANLLHGEGKGMLKAAEKNNFFGISRGVYKRLSKTDSGKALLRELASTIELYRSQFATLAQDASSFIEDGKSLIAHGTTRAEQLELGKTWNQTREARFLEKHGAALFNNQTTLESLETLRLAAIDKAAKGNKKLITKLKAQWKEFSTYPARASKQGRILAADIPTFATVLLLIGILPVEFNQWFTDKEYSKLQEKTNKLRGFARAMDNTTSPLSRRMFQSVNYS